jgi:hypothetical protein
MNVMPSETINNPNLIPQSVTVMQRTRGLLRWVRHCSNYLKTVTSKSQSCPCASLLKHCAFKTRGRSGSKAPSFLTSTLDEGERSASHPGRFMPRYPLDRRLGEPRSRSGRYGEERKKCYAGNRARAVAIQTPNRNQNHYSGTQRRLGYTYQRFD